MANATIETRGAEQEPTVADRILDAARHAEHLSHEARLFKSVVRDAIEDGVHAAKRTMKSVGRGVETLEDLKEETAHRVKRQPLTAVGIAAGAGLVLGVAVGWVGARCGYRNSTGHS